MMAKEYSNQELLDMLRQCKDEMGRVTPQLFNSMDDTCSASTVMRRFESWDDARRKAGIVEDNKDQTGRNRQYSDAEVLRNIRKCARRNDGKATVSSMNKQNDLVAPSVAVERFGSWCEAKEKAGVKKDARKDNHRPREYNDEDFYKLLRECEEKHGKVTQRVFDNDDDFPSSGAVAKRFESWSEAKQLAGVKGDKTSYSDEELLKQVVECGQRHGNRSANTFADDNDFAAPETLQRRFESWSDAKKAAEEYAEKNDIDLDSNDTNESESKSDDLALAKLRKKAKQEGAETTTTTTTKKTQQRRSEKVKEYVLKRAGGVCEGCEKAAPFNKPSGDPYLEVHHVHELSDGGSDKPETVIALCPTCHKRVHHGSNGSEYNQELIETISQIESNFDETAA